MGEGYPSLLAEYPSLLVEYPSLYVSLFELSFTFSLLCLIILVTSSPPTMANKSIQVQV